MRFPNGKLRNKVVDNNLKGFNILTEWIEKHEATTVHVCIEATGVYWEAVAEYLAAQGVTVSVINPAQIKAFGASKMVRTKTDKVDARLIVEFCLERCPDPWLAPTPIERELRAMVLRMEALQIMHTQESNRLSVARDGVKLGIAEHIEWLDKQINTLAKKICDHINDDPGMKSKKVILEAFPGQAHHCCPAGFLCQP